jgi:hypothetical protein
VQHEVLVVITFVKSPEPYTLTGCIGPFCIHIIAIVVVTACLLRHSIKSPVESSHRILACLTGQNRSKRWYQQLSYMIKILVPMRLSASTSLECSSSKLDKRKLPTDLDSDSGCT